VKGTAQIAVERSFNGFLGGFARAEGRLIGFAAGAGLAALVWLRKGHLALFSPSFGLRKSEHFIVIDALK
jgi:hypothetical protein